MKRYTLLVLLIATPAYAQSVSLPPEIRGGRGTWVMVAPKIVGGEPRWRIDPGLQEVSLKGLLPDEDIAKLKGKVFTSAVDGRFKVELWNALGDKASDITVCWVIFSDPQPAPRPDPPRPDPPAPPSVAKHVTFVFKGIEGAAVINSIELRTWLKARGISVHVYPHGDPAIKTLGPAVDKIGLPCFVIQAASGEVLSSGLLTSVQVVKTAVQALGE